MLRFFFLGGGHNNRGGNSPDENLKMDAALLKRKAWSQDRLGIGRE